MIGEVALRRARRMQMRAFLATEKRGFARIFAGCFHGGFRLSGSGPIQALFLAPLAKCGGLFVFREFGAGRIFGEKRLEEGWVLRSGGIFLGMGGLGGGKGGKLDGDAGDLAGDADHEDEDEQQASESGAEQDDGGGRQLVIGHGHQI